MLFGTAIPTSLNIIIGHFQNMETVAANIPMLVYWQWFTELDWACEYMYHGRVKGDVAFKNSVSAD